MVLISLPTLIHAPSDQDVMFIVVWDIKTGAIVKDIEIGGVQDFTRIMFSGHYTVTFVTNYRKTFRTYNALNGALIYAGDNVPQSHRWLDVDREREESFRFATVDRNNGNPVISINQFQPSSTPPCQIVESFIVPHHRYGLEVPFGDYDWEVSFSLASFHASFVTRTEITVLDIRDSKILLRAEIPQDKNLKPGRLSPDGAFFAVCIKNEIHVWQNTSAGYTPWSCLEPRLPFHSFSFSPTGISILAWGRGGVQLLDNHTHILSPNRGAPSDDQGYLQHVVAYSKDGTWIATARRRGNVVTVLDPLSGIPQRSITTATPILDIGIVGNTVIMANMRGLVRWDLEVGKIMHSAFGALAAEIAVTDIAEEFTLSTDCSWIAFHVKRTIFLYDILDQRVVYKHTVDADVVDIRRAPHGRQLCFALHSDYHENLSVLGVKLSETVEQWRIMNVTKEFTPEGVRSWDDLFRLHGCCIRLGSEWIEDSGGKKLLWLSPNWRVLHCWEARFDGNFLALIDGHHPVPIIIVFQPQLLPPSIPSNCRIFSTSPQS